MPSISLGLILIVFDGEFADGQWFLTNASGEAFPSVETGEEDTLYDIIYNETETAIPVV